MLEKCEIVQGPSEQIFRIINYGSSLGFGKDSDFVVSLFLSPEEIVRKCVLTAGVVSKLQADSDTWFLCGKVTTPPMERLLWSDEQFRAWYDPSASHGDFEVGELS